MILHNKRVVVVGGSAGMGLSIARMAAGEGAAVTLTSRSEETAQRVASEIGENVVARALDSSDEQAVAAFFEFVGSVDHVAIPGSSVKTGPVKTTTEEDLLYSIRSKFLGPVACAKYARIAAGGSLTLFSGVLSRKPGSSSLLGAINAAVETLAKGLATELAPVRVNVISPGLTRGTAAYLSMPEEAREGMFTAAAAKLPAGRVGTPEDIAAATRFVMTCGWVTGSVIDVDGGALLI